MLAETRSRKELTNLTNLNLINCNNMLDINGVENLPTSGFLTLSALDYETYLALNKFMSSKLLYTIDEFVNFNEATQEGV